ncbi:hypothetical protein Hanom_Chr12g01071761 [Helianthus anomalus]
MNPKANNIVDNVVHKSIQLTNSKASVDQNRFIRESNRLYAALFLIFFRILINVILVLHKFRRCRIPLRRRVSNTRYRLLIQNTSSNRHKQTKQPKRTSMFIPNHNINSHRKKLVHNSSDSKRSRRYRLSTRKPKETNQKPKHTRQRNRSKRHSLEHIPTVRPNRRKHIRILTRHNPKQRSHHKRQQIVIIHKPPRIQPEIRNHMFNINHFGCYRNQIRKRPRIRSQRKPRIRRNVPNRAPENNQKRHECHFRRNRLLPKHNISNSYQKGC